MEHTTYGDISPRTNFQAWGKLLKRTVPGIVTERSAQTKPMPKGKGRTIKFRRYLALSVITAPLQEGVTPPASKPTYVDVQCTVEQFGDWIGITDVVEDTHEDPIISEFRGMQSRQMMETRESLNINILKGGTNVFYTNGTQRSDINSVMDRGDFRKIVRDLRGNNAEFYMEILAGKPNYDTSPIGPSFLAYGHTDLQADLQGVSGFTEVKNYPDPSRAIEYEVGGCENIRFLLTTMFTAWAGEGATIATMINTGGDADVYPLIIVAPDAWATVPLRGKNSGNIAVVNPKPTAEDPLGQRGTLGWKFWWTAVLLNDDLLARLETAATLNPT